MTNHWEPQNERPGAEYSDAQIEAMLAEDHERRARKWTAALASLEAHGAGR